MRRIADITGQRFGRLIVDYYHEKRKGVNFWMCTCDCGNTKSMSNSSLVHSNIKSCGCITKERSSKRRRVSGKYSAPLRALYRNYKSGAVRRNFEFSITIEDFYNFTKQNCYLCGDSPSKVVEGRSTFNREEREIYQYNGIDRRDNSIGYVKENCRSCCTTCNRVKRDTSLNTLFIHIDRILKLRDNGM